MRMTPDEIRARGLEALRRELGRAGMIRFLQQFENGEGNYAKERREWVDRMSLEDLAGLAAGGRGTKKRRKP